MRDSACTILLRGLEVFGRHGALPAERELGQRFVVDLALTVDPCPATATDALADTVDYAALADAVAAIVAGPRVALLERLAERIAQAALAAPSAVAVEVTVRKPHVALAHTLTEAAVSLRRARGPGASTRYWIGLGANLGDRAGALRDALAALPAAGVEVEAVSSVYETAPQDLADQPPFLNAVARVRTPLAPLALLDALKAIEGARGRTAGGPRYGPRAIDLDVLLWERGAVANPRLRIPHPRLADRRFALVPLLELDPEARGPDGRRLADLAAALSEREQPVVRRPERLEGAIP